MQTTNEVYHLENGDILNVISDSTTYRPLMIYINGIMQDLSDEYQPMPSLVRVTGADVDGFPWHTVKCDSELAKWVRQQPVWDWYEHIDSQGYIHMTMFDVSEKLYTALCLKAKN